MGCSTRRLQPREGYANVPGGRVWFKAVGSGSGPPVLLLHRGPGGTNRAFEPLAALTNERPLLFYDQIGGGRSERPRYTNLWRVDRFVEEWKCVRHDRIMLDNPKPCVEVVRAFLCDVERSK